MLTQYLVEHQIEKNYMFYSKKKGFIHTLQCKDDFILLKDYTINKHGNGYTCKTIKGDLINVLLRWKNGNGIAFPAFQEQRNKMVSPTPQNLFFIYLIDLKKLERRVTFPENLWRYFQSIVS